MTTIYLQPRTSVPAPALLRFHRPPAIVITGSTDTADIRRFEASGHAWLSKPVDSAELRRKSVELLRDARGPA